MKKKCYYPVFILMFTVLGLQQVSCANAPQELNPSQSKPVKQVCYKDHCFIADIADNPMTQQKGLMGRQSLSETDGMLFIFSQMGPRTFWMRGMLISIDIIWMTDKGAVIDISAELPPCTKKTIDCPTYSPEGPSQYVLEIQAGLARKLGIKKGNILEIR